jgi:predicted alpha/beta hydrolase
MQDPASEWLVRGADGHQAALRARAPAGARDGLLFVPAMGVAARHYDALALALAAHGIAVAVHEWRGLGSSTVRARRGVDWGYRELLEADLPASLGVACACAPGVRWRLGGHSLGAQFAALLAAVDPRAHGIFVVAGGAPYWRTFPHAQKLVLRGLFGAMNGLGAMSGYFPGRRTGFAGNEARGVIRDWTFTGRHGHYRVPGLARDHEAALHACRLPVLALRFADDWYVPRASLDHLLAKLPHAAVERDEIDRARLAGHKADHFGWMKHPQPVAEHVARWIAGSPRG